MITGSDYRHLVVSNDCSTMSNKTLVEQNTLKQGLRKYTTLPVRVVEDHNDALQHIYRAIGSRYLPFKEITMLHFDSHPDLQIVTDMDADVVFDKSELLSCLSIENWIMPAVYAGHIDHVIWVKPPWSNQLPEGRRHVSVGKHKHTGKLRITWPDVYFLSDVLFAPLYNLEHSKSVTIDTVTMETDILKLTDFEKSSVAGKKTEHSTQSKQGNSLDIRGESDSCLVYAKRIKFDKDLITNRSVKSFEQRPYGQNIEPNKVLIEPKTSDKQLETIQTRPSVNLGSKDSNSGIQNERDGADVGSRAETVSKAIGVDKPFILDIDLDFFSTKNPFKEVYTKEQMKLLEELYSFTLPLDDSVDCLEHCQQQRALQLFELQEALKLAWEGAEVKCNVDENRLRKVKSLVSSLKAHPPPEDALDAELIHMAGLTCDDTGELPHNISTQEQIDSLLVTMKIMLSRLPQPTMITVARSSHDDYCPPDQVDGIQAQVLHMLESVYGKSDVHLDFNNQVDS